MKSSTLVKDAEKPRKSLSEPSSPGPGTAWASTQSCLPPSLALGEPGKHTAEAVQLSSCWPTLHTIVLDTQHQEHDEVFSVFCLL